jgi:hypothetical protein
MEASTLLKWENNSWQIYGIIPYNILFTIDADNTGSAKRSDRGSATDLRCSLATLDRYSCLDSIFSEHYYFDPDVEKLGVSALFGAAQNTATRDSVTAATFNCTKF